MGASLAAAGSCANSATRSTAALSCLYVLSANFGRSNFLQSSSPPPQSPSGGDGAGRSASYSSWTRVA
jgi:hypothetical protein